jgi:hypothetical protein
MCKVLENLEESLMIPKLPNNACTRTPKSIGTGVVGVGAFSGSLCGLMLVPVKRRYPVPPTSTPEGA